MPKAVSRACPAADCSPRGSACRNEPNVHAVRQDANPDHWQGSELSVTILGSWQYYRAKVCASQRAPGHSDTLHTPVAEVSFVARSLAWALIIPVVFRMLAPLSSRTGGSLLALPPQLWLSLCRTQVQAILIIRTLRRSRWRLAECAPAAGDPLPAHDRGHHALRAVPLHVPRGGRAEQRALCVCAPHRQDACPTDGVPLQSSTGM